MEHNKNLHKLIVSARAGNIKARNEIVMDNIGLIGKYASIYKHVAPAVIEYEDLMQEGVLGLIKAVDMYDIESGHKFSTYAVWWIRQNIGRYVDNNARTIRMPVYMVDRLRAYKKGNVDVDKLTPKQRTTLEIAQSTSMASLDKLNLHAEGGATTMYDVLVTPLQESHELIKHDLNTLISKINPSKRNEGILRDRLDGLTLNTIAKKKKLSRERVRQIEAKLIVQMIDIPKK